MRFPTSLPLIAAIGAIALSAFGTSCQTLGDGNPKAEQADDKNYQRDMMRHHRRRHRN